MMTAPRPLGMPARIAVLLAVLAGLVVAVPSGIGALWFIPYAGVSALLAIRRPGNSIGWLLLALGWAFALTLAPVDAAPEQFADGSLSPLLAAFAVLNAAGGLVGFCLLAALTIVFPSGRLPIGRWGRVARLGLSLGLVMAVASLVMPMIPVGLSGSPTSVAVRNPFAVLPRLPIWDVITPDTAFLPVVALLIGSVISLLVRYRRASGIERQQFRWITAALGFVIVGVLGGLAVGSVVPAASDSGLVWIGAIVAFPCVPVAIGISVLRYRLYEIDRIVSRTIGWTLTTGLVASLFAGLIVALQAVLAPVTNQSSLAVASSTLAAAAGFQPIRRRVQSAVDRRFNRSRYDAEHIVGEIASSLRGQTDLDQISGGVADAVTRSLRPTSVGVWMRSRSAS